VVCKRCSNPLAQDALICGECHALIHSEELDRIAAAAKELEAHSQLRAASEKWRSALPLLPQSANQAEWIRSHARQLELTAIAAEMEHQSRGKWARRLGPLAPIAIFLAKAKTLIFALFKAKFLFSLAAFVAVYWGLFGIRFGIGFAALVLIHEMGHYIDVRRRGLPADMPVFLPGLGAYVRWQALGVSEETRAEVSLAGPLAGLLASFVCAVIWWKTGDGLWAALARAGAWLNLLNLIPVWILDGGQALGVLSRNVRIALLCVCLVLWYALGEGVFFLVAAGMVYRLFTKDLPAKPSVRVAAYFACVLVALALVMAAMPGQGFAK
jgi:Zn-dependent protease